jgi:phosphoglycolate phosphatase-like HAD superfamily hydrolase
VRRFDLPHDLLIAREDTVRFKPDPEPLLRALNAFGVAPENAVMVGDLWPDIAAGRACGVALTVGIQWPHDPPGRFMRCPPDVEVASLGEAAAVLLAGF